MSPPTPLSAGLPASPRAFQPSSPALSSTISSSESSPTFESPLYKAEYHHASLSQLATPRLRSRSSMIFANATIPLTDEATHSEEKPWRPEDDSAIPNRHKRGGFARLFACFGSTARAERRRRRAAHFDTVEVGKECHWTEL